MAAFERNQSVCTKPMANISNTPPKIAWINETRVFCATRTILYWLQLYTLITLFSNLTENTVFFVVYFSKILVRAVYLVNNVNQQHSTIAVKTNHTWKILKFNDSNTVYHSLLIAGEEYIFPFVYTQTQVSEIRFEKKNV